MSIFDDLADAVSDAARAKESQSRMRQLGATSGL
jgi:hypothetical protein